MALQRPKDKKAKSKQKLRQRKYAAKPKPTNNSNSNSNSNNVDEDPHSGSPTAATTPLEKTESEPPEVISRIQSRLSEYRQMVTDMVNQEVKARKRRWLFLGVVLGILLAIGGILYTNPITDKDIGWINQVVGDIDLSSFLPEDLLPNEFTRDVNNLMTKQEEPVSTADNFQPALSIQQEERLEKKHNVILVPGIISSGLESWGTENCSRPYFRQRIWGTSTMIKAILLDKACWIQNMMLDTKTGLDPPRIKVRAAKGLNAADYFITGYWIWGKLIENLSVLGYDSNNMNLASYDWRLSYYDLERRDGYFTELQKMIEIGMSKNRQKTVLIAHSMGSQVIGYFLNWVESPNGANAGDGWVDKHIEAIVNLSGTPLGVPKALSSLLSGEQRETVQPVANYVLDKFLNRTELARIFRSWTSLPSLLPRGGNAIWGDLNGAPDDPDDASTTLPENMGTLGAQIRFDDQNDFNNMTMEDALDIFLGVLDDDARRLFLRDHSLGIFRSQEEMDKHKDDHRVWGNPLQYQLPNAPNMTIFSLYGYGEQAERAYYYTTENVDVDALPAEGDTPTLCIDKKDRPHVDNANRGVVTAQGDGTVPLISLGYMGASGWRKQLYNPHGVRIVSREFLHNPVAPYKDIRGGSAAADHINILGNYKVTEDILRIVSGHGDQLKDRFTSDILKYAERINIP